jgi:hypothetical protein
LGSTGAKIAVASVIVLVSPPIAWRKRAEKGGVAIFSLSDEK